MVWVGVLPQQGACKLTLNVKEGIIQEALVETIGCSGMTPLCCDGIRNPSGQNTSGSIEH